MSARVRVSGYRPGLASWSVTVAFVGLGLLRLLAPLLWPFAAPSAEAVSTEAPYVAGVAVVLVALLAVAVWKDSGRDLGPLGIAALVAALNVGVRATFNVGLGVELNYVLPFVMGLAAGGPLGLLVGAGSCLASQLLEGQIGTPLAGQMFVWGLAGVLGGLLRPLGPRLSSVLAPAVGLGFGIAAGLLYNAISWPSDATADPRFLPVMPFDVNALALVQYSVDTSLGVDLLRGLVTAVGLALVGYPLSRALRAALRPDRVDETPALPDPGEPRPEALSRRVRSRAVTQMWEPDVEEGLT